MFPTIPNDIVDNKFTTLKANLQKILKNMCYAPPEKIYSTYYWNITSVELSQYITIDDYNNIEWVKEMIDIYQNKTSNNA
jgi:hypothetical protein